ncbi:hypothetical protein DSC45_25360 [Streptomyces sp. YIM 130001]|uniref:hypothetical protein n=1 Tax=Streptomyces sp. YIM 130001 TaxID=2259644 RepID=UPI000ECCC189|nr:hypothetical protein [Streptomyces sp. YIM 130001]RII12478.1 hypothetical protein DSC45_25360 [Streptomyces sp. YIM 130001]
MTWTTYAGEGVRSAAEGSQAGSAFVTVLLLGALFGTGVLVRKLRDRNRGRRLGD